MIPANKKNDDLNALRKVFLSDSKASLERFEWICALTDQIRKELEKCDSAANSCAKKLADIAHFLSDDLANTVDLRRESLEIELQGADK